MINLQFSNFKNYVFYLFGFLFCCILRKMNLIHLYSFFIDRNLDTCSILDIFRKLLLLFYFWKKYQHNNKHVNIVTSTKQKHLNLLKKTNIHLLIHISYNSIERRKIKNRLKLQ